MWIVCISQHKRKHSYIYMRVKRWECALFRVQQANITFSNKLFVVGYENTDRQTLFSLLNYVVKITFAFNQKVCCYEIMFVFVFFSFVEREVSRWLLLLTSKFLEMSENSSFDPFFIVRHVRSILRRIPKHQSFKLFGSNNMDKKAWIWNTSRNDE
jgi:hypothetical protein